MRCLQMWLVREAVENRFGGRKDHVRFSTQNEQVGEDHDLGEESVSEIEWRMEGETNAQAQEEHGEENNDAVEGNFLHSQLLAIRNCVVIDRRMVGYVFCGDRMCMCLVAVVVAGVY
ncbi:hypothetical protein RJT34_15758 [Clitoria ternatea]|uniref:Uncharacterized protein n=1 Tax=Clitoria ternatea TaxID=43366 RepID=A0AAN9J619_CLITE